MSSIYDLTGGYLEVYEQIASGEDSQVYLDTLDAINESIEEKADQYTRVIRTIEADNEAISKEINRLQHRKKSNVNGIKNMKERLQFSMEQTGKLAFKTAKNSFGIQNNPPSIGNLNIKKIPRKYFIDQEPQLNKTILKEDLSNGVEVEGAELVQTKSLRIR